MSSACQSGERGIVYRLEARRPGTRCWRRRNQDLSRNLWTRGDILTDQGKIKGRRLYDAENGQGEKSGRRGDTHRIGCFREMEKTHLEKGKE